MRRASSRRSNTAPAPAKRSLIQGLLPVPRGPKRKNYWRGGSRSRGILMPGMPSFFPEI
jgi:hypothetical protein